MPAEWEPHRGTWLSWPHKEASWPGKFAPVPGIFATMVRAPRGPRGGAHQRGRPGHGSRRSAASSPTPARTRGNVFFHHNPTNDAWCRDHGPIFVQRATATGAASRPSSTGATTPGAASIRRTTSTTSSRPASATSSGLPVFAPGIVMEGGSIDVNGRGTLLTTEACLLNPNRNPGARPRPRSSATCATTSACPHILWLGDGIEGDDTDGHVDDLTRFVDARHRGDGGRGRSGRRELRAAPGEPGAAPRHDRPGRPAAAGRHAADAAGRSYHDGQRLPASYANFYIANGAGAAADLRPAARRGGPRHAASGSFPTAT